MAHFPNGKREGVALARVGFQKVLYGIKASSTRVKKKEMGFSNTNEVYDFDGRAIFKK